MAVKRIHSVSRALLVLETIAEHHPIGVSDMARLLDDDISALQRIIVTLSDAGWIRAAVGKPTRWELTAHIQSVAHKGSGQSELRARARATIDSLRASTGESVLLAVVDNDELIAIDILESMHLLRTAPRIGSVLPPRESAVGQAILAHMPSDRQTRILGDTPNKAMLARLSVVRSRGFAVNQGAIEPGSVAVAAPILNVDGWPIAAISVSGPAERMKPDVQIRIGAAVVHATRRLSLSESALAA